MRAAASGNQTGSCRHWHNGTTWIRRACTSPLPAVFNQKPTAGSAVHGKIQKALWAVSQFSAAGTSSVITGQPTKPGIGKGSGLRGELIVLATTPHRKPMTLLSYRKYQRRWLLPETQRRHAGARKNLNGNSENGISALAAADTDTMAHTEQSVPKPEPVQRPGVRGRKVRKISLANARRPIPGLRSVPGA